MVFNWNLKSNELKCQNDENFFFAEIGIRNIQSHCEKIKSNENAPNKYHVRALISEQN